MRLAALLLLLTVVPQDAVERDRSPRDLALSPGGKWAVTANATAGSVSLVDLEKGVVATEVAVGRRPEGIAWAGARVVVANHLADSITILDADPPKLTVAATVEVGDEPRGVAIAGDQAFVVLSGEDAVAVVDLVERKVTARVAVGTEPWHATLSPDGRRLVVGNTRSRDVSVIDTAKLAVERTVRLNGRNVRRAAVSPDGASAYVPFAGELGFPTGKADIENGWVIANRLGRVALDREEPRTAIALDARKDAMADLEAAAVSPDGQTIALAAGGTHELILLRLPLPFAARTRDHIDPKLHGDAKRFRRVPLGGRPVAVAFQPDGWRAVVANYLSNSVQVVDVEKGAVEKTIALGGPAKPSLARAGEAVFYDGSRSLGHWFSCHSCHTDGHTNGGLFDTFGDREYGTKKKTPTLRNVANTGPWTWHGIEKDLRASVRKSMEKTLQGPKATEADLDAILAFLATLEPASPRPPADAEAVKRGDALFHAKRCHTCHAPPLYTIDRLEDVGTGTKDDLFEGYNPPSLLGVGRRAPWLHDGRARSLEELLKKHHAPSKTREEKDFTDAELADVMAFLKSL